MSEQDTGKQIPTNEDHNDVTTGQQQPSPIQSGDADGGAPATGQATDSDAETLTETDSLTDEATSETSETTDANQGGFVASKDDDSSAYLQEEGKQSDKSDIEGSSTFGNNGE